MKRFLFCTVACAVFLTTACSKDDDTASQSSNNSEIDPHYVVGKFCPDRHLASMATDSETQYLTWSNDENALLVSIGTEDKVRTIEYDAQCRQTAVHIPTLLNVGARDFHFEYTGDHLNRFTLTSNGTTLLAATTTYDRNRLQCVNYSNVDQSVVEGFLNEFLTTFRPDQQKGPLPNIGISQLQSDYTWTGGNVSQEHLTATGTTDIAVGRLVQALNLDTSFYRLIIETSGLDEQLPGISPQLLADFVDMLSDSSCHLVVDVDLTLNYTYDQHPNPLYGFWGRGFLGNTQVLSSNNILSAQRKGTANVNFSVNLPASVPDRYDEATTIVLSFALTYLKSQYPDGFTGNYPINMNKTEHTTYTYDTQGWPVSVTNNNNVTTFSYLD